jgi:hypothetical protein
LHTAGGLSVPDIMSAVDIAAEFRDELARLDAAAVDVMLGQWRQVETALIADMEAFAARFEPGQSLTPGQVLRMQRYQALQAQVTAQLAALEGAAGPLITAGQGQAAQIGALQAATTLDALEVGISFNQLSTKATQNIVALARAGKPLAELLQPMYGAASEGIIRELINGVALGYGPRKIARNMARDGMTDALNHLLLVSRDQYNRAARTAAFQRYEDSGVVRGYTRRCARQAGRTCIACISLDGEFYPLSVPFKEHVMGRCTPIPAIKGIEMRSRLGSGQSWFEGLDRDAQVATMGRGRWEAWKAGELPWDKMAVKTSHPVWGPGVRVANVPGGGKRRKVVVKPETQDVKVKLGPNGVPLSGAFDTSKLPKALRSDMDEALRILDEVHGDGELPMLPVLKSSASTYAGQYRYSKMPGRKPRPVDLRMSPHKGEPAGETKINFFHEVGHFLDNQSMRDSGRVNSSDILGRDMLSESKSPIMDGWREAVKNSRAYATWQDYARKSPTLDMRVYVTNGEPIIQATALPFETIRYATSSREYWARSYAQYVATRSGRPEILQNIRNLNDDWGGAPWQWDDDDFEPIAAAMDELFVNLGWLK